MRKQLQALSLAILSTFAGLSSLSVSAQESTILYEQSFDDPTQFEEAAALPKGWSSEGTASFSAVIATDYGRFADSGEYMIVSGYPQSSNRKDVAFTPMMDMKAGQEYKLSVKYMNTGGNYGRTAVMKITAGNGQTADAQTVVLKEESTAVSEWTLVECVFTPETDGQYCFGLWNAAVLSSAGDVMFDTLVIETEATEPEEPAWEASLPYVETFDDATHYTGDAVLPNGWTTLGTSPFSTVLAADYGKVADTGDNVIVSGYPQTSNRQDVAFSPMLNMKAGTEYKIKVKYMMPGLNGRTAEMKITVGMGQSYNDHLTFMYKDRDKAIDNWTLAEFSYVPDADGQYCVGLWASSSLSSAGDVFYDSFSIEEVETEPQPGWEATLPYLETFDEASHFTGDATLPNGWVSNSDNAFNVAPGEDYGVVPNSGANLLVANPGYSAGREDVTFTPMMDLEAGVTYNVSFYVQLRQGARQPSFKFTAGDAQDVAAQTTVLKSYENATTTGWEKVDVTFTPETSGEYCFAFWACSALSNDGFMMVDDFNIEGTEPEEPEWTPSIPYLETFDEGSHYDGVAYLPIGWLATGDEPFVTASLKDKPAISGDYYMVAPSAMLTSRRDIAYTPLMEMEAGVEYSVSFYLYLPGGTNPASFKFTVGREQAYDMQTELFAVSDQLMSDWQLIELTYTPETTAEYCFAFWANSEVSNDGYYCIDDFSLRKADEVLPPSGSIYMSNTLNSIMSGSPLVFPNTPYKLIANVDNADSYSWSVSGSAKIDNPEAKEPSISFTESGSYTIKLVAENKGGSSEFTRKFNCEVVPAEGMGTVAVCTADELLDKIYQQGDLPAYRTDGTVQTADTYEVLYHYVVGVNRYYRAFAERFEMPSNQEVTISSISFNMMNYGLYINTGQGDDADKNFKVVIYPEKDGKPDLANPFYEEVAKVADKLGDTGIYNPVRVSWGFASPAKVKGTFYVALEFDELSLDIDKEWTVGSFFGSDTRQHSNGQTTLYVKPEAAIEGSDFVPNGEYCRADEFSSELKGYGFGVMPWMEIGSFSSVADVESQVRFYVSVDGSSLKVAGLNAGETVNVYSLSGALMASVKADGAEAFIPVADWAKGVYVVSANGKSVKFVK